MPSYSLREVQEQDREPVMEIFNHYVTTGFAAYPDRPMPLGFFDVLRDGAHG
jgi:L-amino acid N-acyltransferase YncA